jgi:hypothetical protein
MTDELTYADVFGAPKSPQVEDGAYDAKLVAIDIKTNKTDGSTFRSWAFDASGIRISDTTSLAMGPDSKAFLWATALLGREPKPGDKLADLIGRYCLLLVTAKPNGYPKVKVMPPRPQAIPDAQVIADEPLTF